MPRSIEKISEKIPFAPKDVFLVFIFSFIFWLLVSVGFMGLIKLSIKPYDASYLRILVRQPQLISVYLILYYLISVILTWFWLVRKIDNKLSLFFDRAKFKEDLIYGFNLFLKSLGILVLFFVCLIFIFAFFSKIFGLDYELLKNTYIQGREAEASEIFKFFKLNAFIIFMAVIFGPFYEEIFYRGCLYTGLRKRLGVSKSIAISSLFFALMHGYIFNFIPVLLLGIILCYAYEKKASLTAPLVLHLCWNTFSALFMFLKV